MLRRCAELDCTNGIVALGIRSSRFMLDDVKDHIAAGRTMVCAWDIHDNGVKTYVDSLSLNQDVYITFDIDSMDPSIAPGTGTTEVGGLNYQQARRFLELVCERNHVIGFDMVEVNPQYDQTELTSLLANQLIADVLGFLFPGEL